MAERRCTTPRKSQRTALGRASRDLRLVVGSEIRRQRIDAGLSIVQLSAEAGISRGYLSLVERGIREASLAVLVAISRALGGDLRVRIYPGTGPRIRDAVQARMVEALLATAHVRWQRYLEVPVYRPVRGVIDMVMIDPNAGLGATIEAHSELRRLEQQIRWAHEKHDAIRSSRLGQESLPATVSLDRILLLRNTRINRGIVERFATTLATEYPGRSNDAYRALTTGDASWPGSTIIWVRVDGDTATIMDRPPRGVTVGR